MARGGDLNEDDGARCALCDRGERERDLVRADSLRPQETDRFARLYADRWPGSGFVCRKCLQRERAGYVVERLEQERGELSEIEADVAKRAGEHIAIAEDLEQRFARETTFGQGIADRVAEIGGSWTFVICSLAVLGAWIVLNAVMLLHAFDPYPYILLNLVLSCIAALQAPIIMMSQNRQAARDRMQAQQDFRVNLKAELEIASLHSKLDHLLHSQWTRMVELQELQIELLTEARESAERE
jgi:uncharacterized membrane protein